MSRLRTINIPGHAYFVTTKVAGNMQLFIDDVYCRIILRNLEYYRKEKSFDLIAYVIMSDHLHYIIWPHGQYTISDILRDFKKQTAKEIIEQLKIDKRINRPLVYTIDRGGRISNPSIRVGGIQNPASGGRILSHKWARTILGRFFVNTKKQDFQVWQPNNWVKNIFSDEVLEQKLNYIHYNPVRVGFVGDPVDFPYSSAAQ